MFPFTYGGVTHHTCADWIYGGVYEGSTWCSTKVDINGVHVNNEGNWGICGVNCISAPKSSENNVLGRKSSSNSEAVKFGQSGLVPPQ